MNYAGILAETTVPFQSKRGDAMVEERVHVRPPHALTRDFFDGNDQFKIGKCFGGDAKQRPMGQVFKHAASAMPLQAVPDSWLPGSRVCSFKMTSCRPALGSAPRKLNSASPWGNRFDGVSRFFTCQRLVGLPPQQHPLFKLPNCSLEADDRAKV